MHRIQKSYCILYEDVSTDGIRYRITKEHNEKDVRINKKRTDTIQSNIKITREMAIELLPILKLFAETGEI